jgi:hypothetical protein
MMVAEVIHTLLGLDQKSDILFVKIKNSPYIYVSAKLPDGQGVLAEMPTGVDKSQGADKDE